MVNVKITLACFVMILAAASAGVALPTDDDPLADAFHVYQLVTLDSAETSAQLSEGTLALDLGGQSFDLEMEPILNPPTRTVQCMDCAPDGGPTLVDRGAAAAYHGVVADHEGSRAVIAVTPTGVFGNVWTLAQAVAFEPAKRFDAALAPDVVVVYALRDVVERVHVHVEPAMPVVDGLVSDLVPQGPSILSVDRSGHYSVESSAYNNAYDAVWYGLTLADDEYASRLGFHVYWFSVLACSTATCDATWGMSSTDTGTLLAQSSAILSQYLEGWGADLAHVVSGKGAAFNCGDGIAWQPGRYSAQIFSTSSCSGYFIGVTVGHEVGHGFAGDHDGAAPNPNCPSTGSSGPTGVWGRARCYARWFSDVAYVCPFPWDIIYQEIGTCVSGGHYEDQGTYRAVRSMMWGAGLSNWVFEVSSGNSQYMVNCNGGSWSGGTYTPGATTGFGSWCTG